MLLIISRKLYNLHTNYYKVFNKKKERISYESIKTGKDENWYKQMGVTEEDLDVELDVVKSLMYRGENLQKHGYYD